MEEFEVYIDATKRDYNAKIDYGVIFIKNDVVWYRFVRKEIDKWGLKSRAGFISAIMLAIKFANEHNLFINININNAGLLPKNIEGMIKSKKLNYSIAKLYKNDFCKQYVDITERYSLNYNIIVIKNNPYKDYIRNISKSKFKSI